MNSIESPSGSGQRFAAVVLVDSVTGLPTSLAGGGATGLALDSSVQQLVTQGASTAPVLTSPQAVYNTTAPTLTNAQATALQTDVNGNLKIAGSFTASSGSIASSGDTTITTGGTAQNLFAGATPTNGWKICNPDASEDLWVSDSTTAAPNGQGSYRVAANGGVFATEPGEKPFHAVSVYGATTGHKITARSW